MIVFSHAISDKKGERRMIDVNKLRGIIAERGESQTTVAAKLGMTRETFYRKMKKGVFDSDEIEQMISCLDIQDPVAVFFAQNVTR